MRLIRHVLFAFVLLGGATSVARSQALTSIDRDRGKAMLQQVQADLREYYYDPTFRGIDLKARMKQAEARIDTAKSNGEIFGIIAQMLSEFDDSHLFFIPPSRAAQVKYGWEMVPIGDSVYVLAVKPGSDAEKKGLRPGDLLLTVNGFTPTRANLWKLRYLFWTLRPQPFLRVAVQDTAGQQRTLELNAEVKVEQKLYDMSLDADVHRIILESQSELDDYEWRSKRLGDILLWQLNAFNLKGRDLTAPLRSAKDARAVVLDLRGNGGGRVTTLIDLVGAFVDHKVVVAIVKGREGTDTVWAEPRNSFTGRLVVLIDGRSGSASEIFARVMQLEGRATVVGDWSAGAVLMSIGIPRRTGVGRMVPFATYMTAFDVRLSDGSSLEHRGVMPDEIVLPTAADLAAGRDPVLTRAVEIAGGRIDPKVAGTAFPVVWAK